MVLPVPVSTLMSTRVSSPRNAVKAALMASRWERREVSSAVPLGVSARPEPPGSRWGSVRRGWSRGDLRDMAQ